MPVKLPTYPDDSLGIRYAKAYKYVFCLLPLNGKATEINGSQINSVISNDLCIELVLPQQIQLREPFATATTIMQDGGKVIESRGQVLKIATVSGTSGLIPPPGPVIGTVSTKPGRLVPNVANLDQQLGAASGYLQFRRLRYLFRLYGAYRRNGNLDWTLHWFDYKNDDYWRIEPDMFDMTRSSRRPMSYDYAIQFKCIEPTDNLVNANGTSTSTKVSIANPTSALSVWDRANGAISSAVTTALGGLSQVQSVTTAVNRLSQLATNAAASIQNFDLGVQAAFQSAIFAVNNVVGVVSAINTATLDTMNVVPALLTAANVSLANLNSVIASMSATDLQWELNMWSIETQQLVDGLGVQIQQALGALSDTDVTDTDQSFSTGRMKQGASTDVIQEASNSSGSPDANPFIGQSGLSLVTNTNQLSNAPQLRAVQVNTGDDVWAFSRRVLGDIQRFVDVVLLNQLQPPFIVSDPTNKPPNTVAWGEYLLVPSDQQTASNVADTGDPTSAGSVAGTITDTGLPTEIIDGTQSWTPNQWQGFTVTVTTGAVVQSIPAVFNDDERLVLAYPLSTPPVANVTTYSVAYVTFVQRRTPNPQERAYGRSWLVNFVNGLADVVFGIAGGVVWAVGLDNLKQALQLRCGCPIGMHPFYPTYGMPAPVGRPVTEPIAVFYVYFMKQSLLADPRVAGVDNAQLSLQDDQLILSANVMPIDARDAQPISFPVGGS